jgi:hypothetical protein
VFNARVAGSCREKKAIKKFLILTSKPLECFSLTVLRDLKVDESRVLNLTLLKVLYGFICQMKLGELSFPFAFLLVCTAFQIPSSFYEFHMPQLRMLCPAEFD